MEEERFRRVVRARIEWLGILQNHVAEIVGLHKSVLSRALAGKRPQETLVERKILFALGLDPDIAVSGDISSLQILAPHPADESEEYDDLAPVERYRAWYRDNWREH